MIEVLFRYLETCNGVLSPILNIILVCFEYLETHPNLLLAMFDLIQTFHRFGAKILHELLACASTAEWKRTDYYFILQLSTSLLEIEKQLPLYSITVPIS